MEHVTKTGKVLTDEDIERLADEAEKGYELTGEEHGVQLIYAHGYDCEGCKRVHEHVVKRRTTQ